MVKSSDKFEEWPQSDALRRAGLTSNVSDVLVLE